MNISPARIAVFGNHSCSNRGDAAIARGLLRFLASEQSECEVDFYTRYPGAAAYILGREALVDPLHRHYAYRQGVKPIGLLKLFLSKKYLAFAQAKPFGRVVAPLLSSTAHREFRRQVRAYDLFVHVGGSFFVDLYGGIQFEALQLALEENVPVLLAGHSLGPFENRLTRAIAENVLPRVNGIMLRETVSQQILESAGIRSPNVLVGGDTAWLMDDHGADHKYDDKDSQRPRVAVTVRDLRPFDRRLGVEQEEYESAITAICERLISSGYEIHMVSMCTGLDSYTHDDRMVALRIRTRVKANEHIHVHMNEPTDLEIGHFLASCHFTIATRLHSAIVSMRFGTPAIAIGYEHKSRGIFEKLGLSELALDIQSFCSGEEDDKIVTCIEEADRWLSVVNQAVVSETALTRSALSDALNRCLP